MKYVLLLTLLFIACIQPLLGQVPVLKLWDKTFGTGHRDQLTSLINTADGGFLIGGHSISRADNDKSEESRGDDDYWVLKLNPDGSKVWDRTIGGEWSDLLHTVAATTDGGYLLGGRSYSEIGGDKTEANRGGGDFWIVKLNADGTKAWDKRFGGFQNDVCFKILATGDGGALLGGWTYSGAEGDKTEAGRGGADYWVLKINADGSKAWDKRFGGSGDDFLFSMIATTDGGYLLGGRSVSGTGGDRSEPSRGGIDYWVVKLNANGSKAWDRRFGGSNDDILISMVMAPDGGYLLGGASDSGVGGDKTEASRGDFDFWILKINANGSRVWDRTFGTSHTEELSSIITISDGNYLVGGTSFSDIEGEKSEPSKGATDYWIMQLNSEGNKIWDKTIGGPGVEYLVSMTRATDNGLVLAGFSDSGIGGDKTEEKRGDFDYWVVKLNSSLVSSNPWEEESENLKVYPNPSNGSFYVMLPDLKPELQPVELVLYNLLGQQVLRTSVKGAELQHGALLQTSSFSSGTYYLQVQAQGKVLTKKVILY